MNVTEEVCGHVRCMWDVNDVSVPQEMQTCICTVK